MSWYANGSCDNVQAPVILMAILGWVASASAGRQLSGLFQSTREQQVHRHRILGRCRQRSVDAGVGRIGRDIVAHDYPDADRTLLHLPVGNDVGDGRIVRIDRFDQAEPVRVLRLDFED